MTTTVLKAKYGSSDRPIRIGKLEIPCYVLEDGTRVLTQYGFYQAIGRSGRPAKGRGSSFEKIAPFLDLQNLIPFVDNELIDSTKPIKFITEKGSLAWGYRAEILPKVCEVYLRARDDGALLKTQEKFASACDIVMRGLAHVGIIALVDEATGYQEVRDRVALQEILDKFITDEWAKWTKTFPDEYYKELFRLKNMPYPPISVKRPSYIGHWTNDIVYDRLAPGVLNELREKNPVIPGKGRKSKHHQYLTRDIGHPKLREHLSNIIFLMKSCTSWEDFKRRLNRAIPRFGDTLDIPFNYDDHEE